MKELGSRRNDLYGNELKGAHAINLERVTDERGFFARRWCAKEFLSHGLSPAIVQVNIGHSANKRGTIRGMHSQYAEVKVVYGSRGALYNVIVDLRDGPSAKGLWVGAELTADNGRMLYVPEGFAYGYQTLEDETDLVYQTSQLYAKEAAKDVRYNDPAFEITWPLPASIVSVEDANWPDY